VSKPYPDFRVLLVDDEPAWLKALSLTLRSASDITHIELCTDSREVMGILERGGVGLIVLDLNMPAPSGEELLVQIAERHPEIVAIVISGMNDLETVVRCMRLGAFDYYLKTDDADRIVAGIQRAIRMAEMRRQNEAMSQRLVSGQLQHPEAFADIVTVDPAMLRAFAYIEAVAASPQPLLITGESGVGKELFARAAHQLSGRAGKLVAVNAAGLDDTFFTDTLFGHVAGAFTGARQARRGMIEEAAHGTLFLDEIGDLTTVSQVKLLRLLQEGDYYPLGSDQPKRSQARVIVATNCDLAAKEAAATFRRDLYYRLRHHHVEIPPLRARRGDLGPLVDRFLAEAAEVLGKKKPTPPPTLVPLLAIHRFPGNVRELKAMVFDAVSAHHDRMLSTEVFARAIGEPGIPKQDVTANANLFSGIEPLPTLRQAGQLLVDEALTRANGNQSLAARLLGISQPALNKRLKRQDADDGDAMTD
jgi:DNA-binding NtrC family response regulator